jgi:hypothetical protein
LRYVGYHDRTQVDDEEKDEEQAAPLMEEKGNEEDYLFSHKRASVDSVKPANEDQHSLASNAVSDEG